MPYSNNQRRHASGYGVCARWFRYRDENDTYTYNSTTGCIRAPYYYYYYHRYIIRKFKKKKSFLLLWDNTRGAFSYVRSSTGCVSHNESYFGPAPPTGYFLNPVLNRNPGSPKNSMILYLLIDRFSCSVPLKH